MIIIMRCSTSYKTHLLPACFLFLAALSLSWVVWFLSVVVVVVVGVVVVVSSLQWLS